MSSRYSSVFGAIFRTAAQREQAEKEEREAKERKDRAQANRDATSNGSAV